MTIINVVGQKMCAPTLKNLAQGSQRFVKFQFNFSEEWNSLKTFAQFRQNNVAYNQYLDEENCVYLPSEIESGVCTLMLYGSDESIIGTTNCLELIVNENGFLENAESTELTESLYNQLVTEFNQLKEQIDNFTGLSDYYTKEEIDRLIENNSRIQIITWESDD